MLIFKPLRISLYDSLSIMNRFCIQISTARNHIQRNFQECFFRWIIWKYFHILRFIRINIVIEDISINLYTFEPFSSFMRTLMPVIIQINLIVKCQSIIETLLQTKWTKKCLISNNLNILIQCVNLDWYRIREVLDLQMQITNWNIIKLSISSQITWKEYSFNWKMGLQWRCFKRLNF